MAFSTHTALLHKLHPRPCAVFSLSQTGAAPASDLKRQNSPRAPFFPHAMHVRKDALGMARFV